ncbi:hypothetical protein GCM10022281_20370 [Sphingomonas rosea]|uniref:Outer membrane protein beta-barrel domain-containing protein n=1 Tax=Sphingomonas rosea TaxID=335605 RepID=A0ABP7UDD1_9SPHN
MKKFLALTALATTAIVAAPAAAAPVQGPRVEALVGYDAVRANVGDANFVDKYKDEGVLYGIGAGYDFALGNKASLGVDLEASDSTVRDRQAEGTLKAGRDLYAGGRVSFPLGADGSNVYLKGGYTNARVTATNGIVSASEDLDGYRIGGGAQFALTGKAYVGGEYRYSNYEQGVERHQLALNVGTRF